jgi:hypothetical protein
LKLLKNIKGTKMSGNLNKSNNILIMNASKLFKLSQILKIKTIKIGKIWKSKKNYKQFKNKLFKDFKNINIYKNVKMKTLSN